MRIAFVFGDPGTSGFTGGDLLALRLANHLSRRAEIEFIRLYNWRTILSKIPSCPSIVHSSKDRLSRRAFQTASTTRMGSAFLRAIGAAATPDPSIGPPVTVRTRVVRTAEKLDDHFDHAIATGWQAAHYLNWAVQADKKHFLVLNLEDNPIYSGELAEAAHAAYDLDLRKLVLGRFLARRFPGDHTTVFYPGVDFATYDWSVPTRNRNDMSVIMPLRAARYKGTDLGLSAIELASQQVPGLSACLFGNKWALRAADLTLPTRTVILNNPTNDQLAAAYNRHRFFLFPSRLEGFPVTPLEAMRCGCLVISTPNEAVTEYLSDQENGVLSQSIDARSLATSICACIKDPEGAEVLRQRAYRTASRYSWDDSYRAFDRALEA